MIVRCPSLWRIVVLRGTRFKACGRAGHFSVSRYENVILADAIGELTVKPPSNVPTLNVLAVQL